MPAKWFIRKLAERLTNTKIPDLNSGLRAFRREVALPYLRLLPPGFSCTTTITIAFLSNQHDLRYIPIDYERSGKSKFRFLDSRCLPLHLAGAADGAYFNPLKVLMPVALTLLGIGIAKGIFDLAVHPLRVAVTPLHLRYGPDHRLPRPARRPHRPLPGRRVTCGSPTPLPSLGTRSISAVTGGGDAHALAR